MDSIAPFEEVTFHELPGMKFDGGKPRVNLIITGMPKALLAVSEVATFGAEKYEAHSWKTVPEALDRYTDAMFRHLLQAKTEDVDPESGLLHAAHAAWGALATLELLLNERQ
jgi:hypothetical protein